MNTVRCLGKCLNSQPTERSAASVARAMRKTAICAGLVIGVAGCANGYQGGGFYPHGVYAGSRYDPYPYYDHYPYGYGTAFRYRNPLYDPFYDDDDDWRDLQRKKWWNSLSDEERAQIKARWKDSELEEREGIGERARARERSEDTEQFWRPRRTMEGATLDGTDDLPLRSSRIGSSQEPLRGRNSGAGESQEQSDDADSGRFLRESSPNSH